MSEPSTPFDDQVIVAELAPEPVREPGLPQPGLLFSIVLALVPLFVQIVVGIAIMSVIAVAFATKVTGSTELQAALKPYEVYLLPIATFTTLLAALAIAVLFFGRNTGRSIGWRGFSLTQLFAMVLFIFPLGILASEATNLIAEVLSWVESDLIEAWRKSGVETFETFSQLAFPLVFVAGCLLPGIGEEILCRGVISRGLIARRGVISGSLWASFLFGAMHMEPVQAFGAFILGLGLQFVFLATRSLAAPIFCHAVNNSFAFLLMRYQHELPLPGLSSAPDEGLHIPMVILGTSALALALASALLFQIRTRWQLSNGEEWSPGYISAERPPAEVDAMPVSRPVSKLLLVATTIAFGAMVAAITWQIN